MEYEWEYLCWKKRQLVLQSKYRDTPPGLSPKQAIEEERLLALAWEDYEERKKLRLTTGTLFPEEPFAGRREEIFTIRNLFANGIGTIFLSGMGGIGKSALARAYGRIYAQEYDYILLWNYDKGIEQIFTDDGQLGISNLVYMKSSYPSRRQYAREKYRKLKEIASSERLLVVLDNYNQMKDPWFPALMDIPCDLLVTTRLSSVLLSGEGYRAITVDSLKTAEDWREFYRIYTGKEPENQDWKDMESYRQSVLGHTLKMKLALCNPEQRWAEKTFARSILSNFRLKKGEIQILCEMTYILLQGIPEEVYLACTEESRESLEALKNFSLVQERSAFGKVFLSLHPVIDEAVRATWHPNETKCFSFLMEFAFYIRHSWNRPRGGDLWLTPQVFYILRLLPEPVPWRFYIYECMATYLFEWEYFGESEQIELTLYECVRSYYGEEHQYTAQVAMRLAAVYHNQMQFKKSRGWYELGYRLYREAEQTDRAYWADRAEACEKLARIYEHEKEYDTALLYTEEAIEAAAAFRKDAEGYAPKIWMDRRMRIQYVYLRRARLYFEQGEIEAAERDLEYALSLFPLNDFQQIEFRMLQIRIDLLKGDYKRAYDAAALDLKISVYYQGESFKDSLSCREQLGDVLSALGEAEAAEEEYIRVLSYLQEKYPYQEEWMEQLQRKLNDI